MKPLHLWLAFAGTLAAAYASHDLQWLTDGRLWMRSVISNEAGKFSADEVEGQLAAKVNGARQKSQQEPLKPDAELRAWISQQIEKDGVKDLPAFTESVQTKFPRYSRLAVCNLQS